MRTGTCPPVRRCRVPRRLVTSTGLPPTFYASLWRVAFALFLAFLGFLFFHPFFLVLVFRKGVPHFPLVGASASCKLALLLRYEEILMLPPFSSLPAPLTAVRSLCSSAPQFFQSSCSVHFSRERSVERDRHPHWWGSGSSIFYAVFFLTFPSLPPGPLNRVPFPFV